MRFTPSYDAFLEIAGVRGQSDVAMPRPLPGGVAAGGVPIQILTFRFGSELLLESPRAGLPISERSPIEEDVEWAVGRLLTRGAPPARRGGKYLDRFTLTFTKYVDTSTPALLQNYAVNQVAVRAARHQATLAAAAARATATAAGAAAVGMLPPGPAGGGAPGVPPPPPVPAVWLTARLVVCRPDPVLGMAPFLEFNFVQPFVLDYRLDYDDPRYVVPVETVDLGYAGSSMCYAPTPRTGAVAAPPAGPAGWNFRTNLPMP